MSQLQVGDKLFKILDNVPEEYTALSDAISRLFYVCGSGKLCGACFQGKLIDYSHKHVKDKDLKEWKKKHPDAFKSRGCCGHCANLSSTGCVQKPLGCAAWQCPYSSLLLPERISRFLAGHSSFGRGNSKPPNGPLARWIAKKLSSEVEGKYYQPRQMFSYFRLEGFSRKPLTARDLAMLATATRRIERIICWLERTGLNKPNWPLMEKITRAEKGVLGYLAPINRGKEVNMTAKKPSKKKLKSKTKKTITK